MKQTAEIYNKPDNDSNNNDNNGGTTIYKAELNFENKQEKSRPNSNEFKRLLIGGELGIRTPGSFHYDGFQDRCFRPLSQLSIFSLMFTCQHNEICGARDKFCALRHYYALGIRALHCFILCVARLLCVGHQGYTLFYFAR